MAESDYMTVQEAADELCVSAELIRRFIRQGIAEAVERGSPGAKRPTWAVSRAWVQAEKARRASRAQGASNGGELEACAAL